ncbi:1-acylglycerol-3-phosphate O-acyltransferase [Alteromonadaceae bacterium BrNp21-10]|nr:1-acylglycerol-3-phosphate O-acyltransferase [Alteromonadaceae bacterium BrNp21-10]
MVALIRLPLICLYFILVNIVLVIVCIARPFHRDNVYAAGKLYSSTARLFGLKVIFRSDEALKNKGPYVFIGNHQNSFDIFTICGAAMPGTVTIGKKSLIWIPLFGLVYWLSGNILIDRKNSNKARGTLDIAARKIRERKLSVWMFPEGTRSNGQGLLPFKSGAFKLAQLTKEPVVMICASSLHQKVKLNRWNNGTLLVDVLAPIQMDDSKTTKEWASYFHQQMQTRITQLDEEVKQLDRGNHNDD